MKRRGEAEPYARARSPYKFAGGKAKLLPELEKRVPEEFADYYEPFCGGAALFWHLWEEGRLPPRKASLNDSNDRVATTLRAIRDRVDDVISILKKHENDEAAYYRVRKWKVDDLLPHQVAAWFIYVTKVGFNGLYRVNRKGEFNVPFGRYANPTICDEPRLRACSRALQEAIVRNEDFEDAVAGASEGDFVYFDPPYAPLSKTSSFTSYTKEKFGHEDQVRLRDRAEKLKEKGVRVLISNSYCEEILDLYGKSFKVEVVEATRSINSKGDGRGKIREVLIT